MEAAPNAQNATTISLKDYKKEEALKVAGIPTEVFLLSGGQWRKIGEAVQNTSGDTTVVLTSQESASSQVIRQQTLNQIILFTNNIDLPQLGSLTHTSQSVSRWIQDEKDTSKAKKDKLEFIVLNARRLESGHTLFFVLQYSALQKKLRSFVYAAKKKNSQNVPSSNVIPANQLRAQSIGKTTPTQQLQNDEVLKPPITLDEIKRIIRIEIEKMDPESQNTSKKTIKASKAMQRAINTNSDQTIITL